MNPRIRALMWEECRTGGSIAAAMAAVGGVLLLIGWSMYGVQGWERDASTLGFALYVVPILAALLLVLNPDHAGHLVGGFSRRVLRLPVTTVEAVGVALALRVLFIAACSAAVVAISSGLFEASPGVSTIVATVLFYLAAQLFDWLRGPFRGLSSVLAVVVAAELIVRAMPGEAAVTPMKLVLSALPLSREQGLMVMVLAPVIAFAVSVAAVTADRVGRRYGVPEIWEWPGRLSIGARTSRARAPFRSAMSAQVWFELRRSLWILPIGALVPVAIAIGIVWLYLPEPRNWSESMRRENIGTTLFAFFLLAAIAQGMYSRVVGFRRTTGKPGYELLQPLTTAQFAWARTLANLFLLLPTLTILIGAQWAISGPRVIAESIPEGLELGIVSPREVAQLVIGPGLAFGLAVWGLLAVGTRVFRRWIGAMAGVFLVLWAIHELDLGTDQLFLVQTGGEDFAIESLFVVAIVPIVLTLTLLANARRRGLLSPRHLAVALGAWALAAWAMGWAALPDTVDAALPWDRPIFGWLHVIGFAALAPLPYVAMLFDVGRKRHGTARRQDGEQHAAYKLRPAAATVSVVVAAMALWLGWPARPRYLEFRERMKYPTTLAELKAAYPEVPKTENVVARYEELSSRAQALRNELRAAEHRTLGAGEALDAEKKRLVVNGERRLLVGPIARDVWAETEKYWLAVTSKVVDDAIALAGREPIRAHFETKFHRWELVDGMGGLKSVQAELYLDALHWAVAGDPARATRSALATFGVARAAESVPMQWGQRERLGMLMNAASAARTVLNRSLPDDAALARLQAACEAAMPDAAALDRAIIEESAIQLRSAGFSGYWTSGEEELNWNLVGMTGLMWRLLEPSAGSYLAISLELERVLALRRESLARVVEDVQSRWERWETFESGIPVKLNVGLLSDFRGGVYEHALRTRMRLQTTAVALAVERYRLAKGALPERLEQLAPEFIATVPLDETVENGQPPAYHVQPDGSHVVTYDGVVGVRAEETSRIGWYADYISTHVAGLEARRGSQVAQ